MYQRCKTPFFLGSFGSKLIPDLAPPIAGPETENFTSMVFANDKTSFLSNPLRNLFLSPSVEETKPPFLGRTVDGQVVEMDPKTAQKYIYSGCYVDCSVEIWAQDNQYGQRVNAQLRGVMFVRDGDAFGAGGSASADEFTPATEGADADDMS